MLLIAMHNVLENSYSVEVNVRAKKCYQFSIAVHGTLNCYYQEIEEKESSEVYYG